MSVERYEYQGKWWVPQALFDIRGEEMMRLQAELTRLRAHNAALREALAEARIIIIEAVKAAVDIPGFDPATHSTVVKIDAALRPDAAQPAHESDRLAVLYRQARADGANHGQALSVVAEAGLPLTTPAPAPDEIPEAVYEAAWVASERHRGAIRRTVVRHVAQAAIRKYEELRSKACGSSSSPSPSPSPFPSSAGQSAGDERTEAR